MGTYIPHEEGAIRNIVRGSLSRYQVYANPPQDTLNRLERLPDVQIGPKALHEYAVLISGIPTFDHSHARYSICVHRATKSGSAFEK